MSEHTNLTLNPAESKSRPVGGTENSWCKAIRGGTGITVLALLFQKSPDIYLLQSKLHKLQDAHPILKSKIHYNSNTNAYSYVTPSSPPHLQVQHFDLDSTSDVLQKQFEPDNGSISRFHLILEHELNRNSWTDINLDSESEVDLMFASVYSLGEEGWVLALRFHTSACDRTTAVSFLRELVVVMSADAEGRQVEESEKQSEVNLGVEEYIPSGKGNKPIWARGIDMLGYSLNSFRLANFNFQNTEDPRSSRVMRLRINAEDTEKILSACESRGIKLCGLMSAAGLIAARSTKNLPEDQWEKYAVVTLIDCRSILDPVLTPNHHGFYHSAIMNTHDIKGGEGLWELANRTYSSFANAKRNNKHFTDMADVNFLMCKAIENPGLTPSSSLRTSIISVFEEPVIDRSDKVQQECFGLEDYMGCASVHGIGPSIAVFDTIRDGELDCACVYPSPLHSRKQMRNLVDDIKRILIAGCSSHEEVAA